YLLLSNNEEEMSECENVKLCVSQCLVLRIYGKVATTLNIIIVACVNICGVQYCFSVFSQAVIFRFTVRTHSYPTFFVFMLIILEKEEITEKAKNKLPRL